MAKVSDKITLATAVYQKLRMDIINGSFQPGEKLRIETIAATHEVGSNAVREALSRLSSERLVDRHEQRGFSVPAIALEEWRVLVKTRCWLETRALEESINNRTAAWEEGIVVAFHRLSRYKSSGFPDDRPGWEDAHRSFHRALLSNCGSPWLLDFCDILADHAARYVSVSNAFRTVPRDGTAEHEALMKVVIDGNSHDACAALVTHYTRTLQLIEHLFDGGVMSGDPVNTTGLPAIDPAELLKLNF